MGPDAEKRDVDAKVPWWSSCRLMLAIIAFFGFLNAYCQRVGMSVAIVCMVNQTAVQLMRDADIAAAANDSVGLYTSENGGNHSLLMAADEETCDLVTSNSTAAEGPFVYSKTMQGHILSSFFYGYLLTQIPGGMLGEKFGGKKVYGGFFAVSTIATLLTPLAAKVNVYFLIVMRIIAGMGGGALFPCMHSIWGRWAPPLERSILVSIACAGAFLGNAIAYPISGALCSSNFSEGWDSIFYVFGITSTVWFVVWMIFTSDTPNTNRMISKVEKDYIQDSLQGQVSKDLGAKRSPPYLKMLTSMPVWAIVVGNTCTDWGLYTFLTNIPTYMFEVLKFDIQSNGLFSALPFLGLYVTMSISAVIADKLRQKQICSTTTVRKILQCGGCGGAAVFLIALGFISCSQSGLAVVLLTLGVTFTGFTYSGWLPNHTDIAPKYAGTLYGFSNCIGSITGFISPVIAAAMTPNQTREEWQRVFFVAAAIYLFGTIFYGIFGSGELQDWAREETGPEDVPMTSMENGKVKDKDDLKPENV